jgi:acetyl esterase/lipase
MSKDTGRIFHTLWALAVAAILTGLSHAQQRIPEGVKAHRDLAYVTNGHARQKLDLYIPEKPKGPLLVYIHGGGWLGGDKGQVEGLPLLHHGYCVASLNYRFSNQAIFPAQIEDCKAAIRWLRAHAAEYGYDPKRIGAWGGSAGGHLTALLATTGTTRDFDVGENLEKSSAIRCGIDVFGPTDFPGYVPPNDSPMIQRTGKDSVLVQLLGGPVDEKLELARKASPVTWASKDSAPLYILHGTVDPLVPLEQSQRLADKYKAAGVEVTLDVVEGAGHGGPQFFADDRPRKLLEFLERHLGAPSQ